jgi:ABC-type glycerol-3-phosphate transport system substrate-binding protein
MRKILATMALAGLLVGASAMGATAAPLPDNCQRVQGTVTCTTFDGPGNNQAGVGTTDTTETQGNTSNKSPKPQDLTDDCSFNPPTSQGAPNGC